MPALIKIDKYFRGLEIYLPQVAGKDSSVTASSKSAYFPILSHHFVFNVLLMYFAFIYVCFIYVCAV